MSDDGMLRELLDRVERIEIWLEELAAKQQTKPTDMDEVAGAIRWRHGRRPKFWRDAAVRDRAIALRTKMTIAEAAVALRTEFGEARAPSKSALHRFWLVLAKSGVAR